MLRSAKLGAKYETQLWALHISRNLAMLAGSEVYFNPFNPEAHAALAESQKTATTVVIQKSYTIQEILQTAA